MTKAKAWDMFWRIAPWMVLGQFLVGLVVASILVGVFRLQAGVVQVADWYLLTVGAWRMLRFVRQGRHHRLYEKYRENDRQIEAILNEGKDKRDDRW